MFIVWMIQANRASVNYEPLTEGEREDIQRQVRQYVDGTLADIEVEFLILSFTLLIVFLQIINVRQIKETFAQFKFTIQLVLICCADCFIRER